MVKKHKLDYEADYEDISYHGRPMLPSLNLRHGILSTSNSSIRNGAFKLKRRRSPSPMRRRSPSPMRRRSPSPMRRRSPSPMRRRSPSPMRRRLGTVRLRSSPVPIRFRSISPVRNAEMIVQDEEDAEDQPLHGRMIRVRQNRPPQPVAFRNNRAYYEES